MVRKVWLTAVMVALACSTGAVYAHEGDSSDGECGGTGSTASTSVHRVVHLADIQPDPYVQFREASEQRVRALLNRDPDFCGDQADQLGFKPHEPEEVQGIEDALRRLAPLFKCDNKPPLEFARVSKMYFKFEGEDCKSKFASYDCIEVEGGVCDLIAGLSYFRDGTEEIGVIIIADPMRKPNPSTDFPPGSNKRLILQIHEAGHYLFDHFDPETCTPYPNPLDPPLLKRFMATVGWDPTGDTLTVVPGNRPPTRYASAYGPVEDFMESFAVYIVYPDLLKERSPLRHDFFRDLLAEVPVQ